MTTRRISAALPFAWLKQSHRALLATFTLVSALLTASAASLGQAGALWVAESAGLLNVATDSGQIAFEIPHADG
ncbi:MAG: hypothetical protein ACREU7_06405, partial [Burkholderiales bacterium]